MLKQHKQTIQIILLHNPQLFMCPLYLCRRGTRRRRRLHEAYMEVHVFMKTIKATFQKIISLSFIFIMDESTP